MPDSTRGLLRRAGSHEITTASSQVIGPPMMNQNIWTYETWQQEGWDFRRNLGECSSGMDWLKYSMSRVRVVAAEMVPGQKDPAILTPDDVRGHEAATAAFALATVFAGGTTGQADLMGMGAVHLGVPGECVLLVERTDEQVPLAFADWRIVPNDAIRPRGDWWEVRIGENAWRPVAEEALPTRIMEPDEQYPWRAWSAIRPALPIMRTIDLLNRRIISTLVSRIAMNGIMFMPQEAAPKVPDQYKGNPFWVTQKLIDAAMNNIRNPGSAGAALPQILDYPKDFIEQIRHITLSDGVTKELLDEREAEIKRLAVTLTMPVEALLGYGDMNHWSAWKTDEQGVKIYIAPKAETLVGGFTKGVMHPILRSNGLEPIGPRGGQLVFWYDATDLIARPDLSAHAKDLYDRKEINGAALRQASGFDEDAAPTKPELQEMILKGVSDDPTTGAPMALEALTGWKPPQVPAADANPNRPGNTPALSGTASAAGTPGTRNAPRPAETSPEVASIARMVRTQVGVPDATQALVGIVNGTHAPRGT